MLCSAEKRRVELRFWCLTRQADLCLCVAVFFLTLSSSQIFVCGKAFFTLCFILKLFFFFMFHGRKIPWKLSVCHLWSSSAPAIFRSLLGLLSWKSLNIITRVFAGLKTVLLKKGGCFYILFIQWCEFILQKTWSGLILKKRFNFLFMLTRG